MQIHHKLPEGCAKALFESEFYRLRYRKKMLYEDNREFREGLRYLIWSRYGRCWWERTLGTYNETEEDISYFLSYGWLWLYPTEEQKEEIREDVEKNGIGYYPLMKRRQAEMNWERHNATRNDGNGWLYRMDKYKREKQRR